MQKFPAFASADLSTMAKFQGAFESEGFKEKGYYFLRTPAESSYDEVEAVFPDGSCRTTGAFGVSAGLRVSVSLLYVADSIATRSCREVTKTSKVKINNVIKEITSTAPVIKYGEVDYIWLNREECENGSSKVMECVSLELVERAEPLDKNYNVFGNSKEFLQQCYRAVFDTVTDYEKLLCVEVKLDILNEKVEYNLPKANADNSFIPQLVAGELFIALADGKISVEQWKESMMAIVSIMRKDSAFNETDVFDLGIYIVQKFDEL